MVAERQFLFNRYQNETGGGGVTGVNPEFGYVQFEDLKTFPTWFLYITDWLYLFFNLFPITDSPFGMHSHTNVHTYATVYH